MIRSRFFRLVGGAAALAGMLVATGCSASSSPDPTKGGTVTFGTSGEPDSWDLHVSVSSLSAYILRSVYDSLVNQKDDGSFEPWLAESWKVSDDGLAYTFDLRDDVTFSNGEPFDAEAVKANLDHVVAPETQSRNARTHLGPYESTEVIDDDTVIVHLSEPYSPLLAGLSTPYLGFHAPSTLQDPAQIALGGEHIVSTGPFAFTELVSGERAVFERRDDYAWGPESSGVTGAALLDGYTVQFLPDDAARVGAFTSGQLDIVDQVPSNRFAELRSVKSVELLARQAIGAPFTYGLNSSRAPFDDVNVRRAFQAAADITAITEGLFQGEYDRGWSPLTPSTSAYDASLEESWGFDLDLARELLDEAGYTEVDAQGYRVKDGQRLTVTLAYAADFTSGEQLNFHTALKDAVAAAGFELVLDPLDTPSIIASLGSGDYDLGAGAATSIDASVLGTLFRSDKLPAEGGANTVRVADPELDGWLHAALETTDLEEQADLYGKVQRKVIEEAYVLPTFISSRTVGVQDRVEGLALDAQNLPRFAGASVR